MIYGIVLSSGFPVLYKNYLTIPRSLFLDCALIASEINACVDWHVFFKS
ncbi:MAG: hypothetical protein JWP12_3519 [Bacteroidetes bacterium]|nr:hypothetical protein [Bacteroidota bacterium]